MREVREFRDASHRRHIPASLAVAFGNHGSPAGYPPYFSVILSVTFSNRPSAACARHWLGQAAEGVPDRQFPLGRVGDPFRPDAVGQVGRLEAAAREALGDAPVDALVDVDP